MPDHLILTEYHILRQALWFYIRSRYGPNDRTTDAIMRLDTAITLATTASIWGYFREEGQKLGKWESEIERLIESSPLLPDREP